MEGNSIHISAPSAEVSFDQTCDAAAWAREFMKIVTATAVIVDEDMMIGWFANAIERGRAAGVAAGEKNLERDYVRRTIYQSAVEQRREFREAFRLAIGEIRRLRNPLLTVRSPEGDC